MSIKPEKDWLEKIVANFEKDPKIIGVTGPSYFYETKGILRFLSWFGIILSLISARFLMGHHQFNGHNMAIKKRVISKMKPHIDIKLVNDDIDLSCHAKEYGKIVCDFSLVMPTSARHFERNAFFLLDYSFKHFYSIFLHHPSHILHKVS